MYVCIYIFTIILCIYLFIYPFNYRSIYLFICIEYVNILFNVYEINCCVID